MSPDNKLQLPMDSLRAASDRVVICLEKAEADLKAVEHRLEEEFQQTYAGKGVSRTCGIEVCLRMCYFQKVLHKLRN